MSLFYRFYRFFVRFPVFLTGWWTRVVFLPLGCVLFMYPPWCHLGGIVTPLTGLRRKSHLLDDGTGRISVALIDGGRVGDVLLHNPPNFHYRGPVHVELTLVDPIYHPVKSHIDRFRSFVFHCFIYESDRRRIVNLYWCWWLWVS